MRLGVTGLWAIAAGTLVLGGCLVRQAPRPPDAVKIVQREPAHAPRYLDGAGIARRDLARAPELLASGSMRGAIARGDMSTVKRLLDTGNDPNGQDKVGTTPLHYAAMYGQAPIVGLLIARGAKVDTVSRGLGWTPLQWATFSGSTAVAETLLAHGAEVDARGMLGGGTPLHWAAQMGRGEITGLLLQHGAKVNARDDARQTPLHLAALYGEPDEVALLLAAGADPNAADGDGTTPLHYAAGVPPSVSVPTRAEASYVDVADKLLRAGARANARDQAGQTPRAMALKSGRKQVALLLRQYANERPHR